jgi:hypothetical protein
MVEKCPARGGIAISKLRNGLTLRTLKQFHGPEVFQRPPESLLRMGLNGKDRFEIPLPDHRKQFAERDIPLPHRQVLIKCAVVVVDVDLSQEIAQCLDPKAERHAAEGVGVPGIEAEADLRRGKRVQEQFQRLRVSFIDILQGDDRLRPPDAIEEGPPGGKAVFKPLRFGGDIVSFVEGGMADHGTGPEPGDQVEDLTETVEGNLPDPGIERPRPEVHEGGVKGHRKACIGKTFSCFPEIGRLKTVEVMVVKTNLRVDLFPEHHGQQLFPEEMEWHMNLDFLQNLPHEDRTSVRLSVPFTTSGSVSQPPIFRSFFQISLKLC